MTTNSYLSFLYDLSASATTWARLAMPPSFLSFQQNLFASFNNLTILCFVLLWVFAVAKWTYTKQRRKREAAEVQSRIRSLQYQLNVSRRHYSELKVQLAGLKATNSLLKADNVEARQMQGVLQQKHIQSVSLAYSLSSEISSLAAVLASERNDVAKQKMRLRLVLGLILGFVQFVRLASSRIRFLSAGNAALQSRFSVLLSSHLALRQRYLNLEDLCLKARQSANKLALRLEHEETLQKSLENDKMKLSDACHAIEKDCQFYQALAWTVVARYDSLQSEYGQLLVSFDQLKGDCRRFREDLRQVATQVQETLDITEIGLNGLHHAANLRPMKFKQDLMRIGQGLDFTRLSITELLAGMVLVDARKAGASSPGPYPPYAPGSIEDAVRRLKTLYDAAHGEQGCDNERNVEADLSVDELQEVTLANISNLERRGEPMRYVMESLHDIISKIEGSDVRESFMSDSRSTSDIANKLQQLVDEPKLASTSKDDSGLNKSGLVPQARSITNSAERYPKIVSLLNEVDTTVF